jgi:hypothetical protein
MGLGAVLGDDVSQFDVVRGKLRSVDMWLEMGQQLICLEASLGLFSCVATVKRVLKYVIKRPLGRLRRRREDDIRMDPTEIGWEGVDWIYLAEDRNQ